MYPPESPQRSEFPRKRAGGRAPCALAACAVTAKCLEPCFAYEKGLEGGRWTIEIPAVGMGGQKNILCCHHAGKDRRRQLKGKNSGRRDAIAGVGIETLPLCLRLMVGADGRMGGGREVQRVQPDTAQQQRCHG